MSSLPVVEYVSRAPAVAAVLPPLNLTAHSRLLLLQRQRQRIKSQCRPLIQVRQARTALLLLNRCPKERARPGVKLVGNSCVRTTLVPWAAAKRIRRVTFNSRGRPRSSQLLARAAGGNWIYRHAKGSWRYTSHSPFSTRRFVHVTLSGTIQRMVLGLTVYEA